MSITKGRDRIIGGLFLAAFLAYGLGNGLIESALSAPDYLGNLSANPAQLVIGVVLMSILHSATIVGIAVLVMPVLQVQSPKIAQAYFASILSTSVILLIGTIFLLLLIPLSQEFVKNSSADVSYYQVMAVLFRKVNFFAYQLGMIVWGMGGLLFCYSIFRGGQLPAFASVWGLIAYLVFMAGAVAELFGFGVGILLSIPGGLFEIFLSIWLLVKGFKNKTEVIST
jgi:Domain of unknown function (DUF4386)